MTGVNKQHSPRGASREVTVSKMGNSRVGIGLVNRNRRVHIAQVAATSPLEGLVFPGDIINLAGNGHGGKILDALTSTRAPDAVALSAAFHAASVLTLSVETPEPLANARSVFILMSQHDVELGITLEKDPHTGRARIARLAPGSAAATRVDRDVLAPGDLVVAVAEGGVLYEVANVKEATARLDKRAEGGAIELRVVRPLMNPLSSRSSRPSSAACRADLAPSMGVLPPPYTTAVALPPGCHL